jgi:hypothetical protein
MSKTHILWLHSAQFANLKDNDGQIPLPTATITGGRKPSSFVAKNELSKPLVF